MASFSPSEKCYATGIYPEQERAMEKFTASEVHESAIAVAARDMEYEAEMLQAYADRLEADEKAVPVGCLTVQRFRGSDAMVNHDFDYYGSLPDGSYSLYTQSQSAPSDAERLAEALRACALNWQEIAAATWRSYSVSASNVDKASAIAHMHCAQDIRKALAAHCAQAQPPAASVTDAMVKAAMRADFCGHNVADALMCGTDWNTEVMRAALEAALAAQENPNG